MKKIRLYARPRNPPKWWPVDENGKPQWVGVLKDGIGWVRGKGDVLTYPQAVAARQFVEIPGRGKRFREEPAIGQPARMILKRMRGRWTAMISDGKSAVTVTGSTLRAAFDSAANTLEKEAS